MYIVNGRASLNTEETQGLGILVTHELNVLLHNESDPEGNCCNVCCAPCGFISLLATKGVLKAFIALAPDELTEEWLAMSNDEIEEWLLKQWASCPNHESKVESDHDTAHGS